MSNIGAHDNHKLLSYHDSEPPEISEQFKNLYLQKFQKGSLKFQNN